jgi:hypothetical protein
MLRKLGAYCYDLHQVVRSMESLDPCNGRDQERDLLDAEVVCRP